VPEQIRRAARAAFASRAAERDRALAVISYDSVLDDGLALRGPESDDRRILAFDAGTVTVEVELTGDRMIGQLVPPMEGTVEVMTAEGTVGRTTADAVGCFTLGRPAPGPVRLRCEVASGVVVTDWVRL
jgi:hypothetical protein